MGNWFNSLGKLDQLHWDIGSAALGNWISSFGIRSTALGFAEVVDQLLLSIAAGPLPCFPLAALAGGVEFAGAAIDRHIERLTLAIETGGHVAATHRLPVSPIHANRPVGAPVRANIFSRFGAVQELAAALGSAANCTTDSGAATAVSGGNFGAGGCCCCCCCCC